MLSLTVVTLFAGFLLAGAVYEELARRKDARRFPPRGQLVDVGGRYLHLLSKGTEGPSVVIEQGAGGPSLNWLGLQDEIAKFARVCIYDRAGYQWSEPVRGRRSLEDRVQDLHTVLVKGKVPGPYVLVGHSYGGFLIRLFAREYPGETAGLVLVDSPQEEGYFTREVLSFYSKFALILRVMSLLARFGVPRLVTRVMTKPDIEQAELNSGMVRQEYFAAASDDTNSLKRASARVLAPHAFGSLGDRPITVITHGQPFPGPFAVLEKGWREGQERLAALSSNSELVVAEKSNHMIQNDQPEIVIEAIRSVVRRARTAQGCRMA